MYVAGCLLVYLCCSRDKAVIFSLKGQMSLVGPRMMTSDELKHFRRWRHNLLTVKPGLTGLWQVSGRSDLSYEERVRMDMQYIRNYTIWQDLKLLLNTVGAVLAGRGAYWFLRRGRGGYNRRC
jgi:lipopolysaccharide/colanic/teichoic acid biosynthesis glycosyltransferase